MTRAGLDPKTSKALYSRIADRLGGESAITSVGEWLCDNTFLDGKPWTFRHHEFQQAICNCTDRHVVVQKPTQVGLTELSLRIALALCALRSYFKVIYVLPSAQFAGEVSKMRISPMIETSERLSSMLVPGADGAMAKRIGTSIFYMGGAATERQTISRPAEALFFDEKDYCNQSVLQGYFGRLDHVEEAKQLIREFSTPTVGDYGINRSLLMSSRARYLVKCEHCGEWQAPDFATQVRVPGWDGDDFHLFTRDDLPNCDTDAAYLACRKCYKSLNASLLDTKREWVDEVPGASVKGFEVKPYDLPKYNTIPRLVRKIADRTSHKYWNDVQGEVFQSESNSVNLNVVGEKFCLGADHPLKGCSVGIDVGDTYCYAMAGRKVGAETHVLWRKRYAIADGPFEEQIRKDLPEFVSGVMDRGPNRTLSRSFTDNGGERFYACTYRKDKPTAKDYFEANDETKIVSVQRTTGFNLLVEELNKGLWKFAIGPDQDLVLHHFGGMKRLQQATEEGDYAQQWVKVGDKEDHFFHAAMYLKTAIELLDGTSSSVIGTLPNFRGVSIGTSSVQNVTNFFRG